MPTYEYRCTKCKHQFELFHSITDDTVKRCPKCKSKAVRVPAGGAGLLFKGSGFYITDYRSKSYKEKAKQEKSGGEGGKSESGKGESGKGESGKKDSKREGGGGKSESGGSKGKTGSS
jgi:putative FmdB family regulatory protein